MVQRAVQGDCKREHFLGVHFLSLALKESVLIVIGNGIVGSERSVESPDCLLLYVILKLLLPPKMCSGVGEKIVCIGMLAGVLWVCTSSHAVVSEHCSVVLVSPGETRGMN